MSCLNFRRLLQPLYLLGLGLLILTMAHFLWGHSVFYPWDARGDLPVSSSQLSFSWWGALIEPVAAPLHILAAVPDIRIGVMSFLVWVSVSVGVYVGYAYVRKIHVRSIVYDVSAVLFWLLLSGLFYLLIPLPNWSLENRASIVSDLHSHSLLSHDGVVTLSDNLSVHQARGYDLVALTNHASESMRLSAHQAKRGDLPEVMPGVEIPVYYGGHFYLSVLGATAEMVLPDGLAWYEGSELPHPPASLPDHLWSVKRLVQQVHQHGGAVAVVALNLNQADVIHLTQAGVDAFEIVNFGHHSLSEEVRQTMLKMQREHGVALIASNDWHGWTGMLNTWTLIEPLPESLATGASLQEQVLAVLRQHQGQRVTPVTAYPIHAMTPVEVVFAPFIALFQYAKTISIQQLVAWWGYFLLWVFAAKFWRCQRLSLAECVPLALVLGMSGAIVWHDVALYIAWLDSVMRPPLAWQVSVYSGLFAAMVLLLTLLRLHRLWRRNTPSAC